MIKAWLERDPMRSEIHLYVFAQDRFHGQKSVAKPVEIVFEDISDPGPLEFMKYKPFMSFDISGELLRAIADALEEYGLLKNEDNPGELKATKYHLEDMRRIALLDIPDKKER